MTPDRRPIRWIRPWAGFQSHPRGLRTECATADGWLAWTLGQMTDRYADGYRRLAIILPAGKERGQDHHGVHHWWCLPEVVRSGLIDQLPLWLRDRPDAVVFPYQGFHQHDPRRFHNGVSDCWSPNRQDPEHARLMALATEPWLSLSPSPGQVGLGFDAASKPEHRGLFLDWAWYFEQRGIPVIGEALPQDNGILDPKVGDARWWASTAFMAPFDWTVDPLTTECHVFFDGADTLTAESKAAWEARGFICSVVAPKHDAVVLG